MNKRLREIIYKKYNGHCAYCGKEITMEKMQVDHFIPLRRGDTQEWLNKHPTSHGIIQKGSDDVSNLVPSCSQCNFRKGQFSIEKFREELRKQAATEMKRFQARQSADYGLIEYHDHPVVFFFEKVNNQP